MWWQARRAAAAARRRERQSRLRHLSQAEQKRIQLVREHALLLAKIHELQTKQASMTDELKKATENETSAVTVLKAANEVP